MFDSWISHWVCIKHINTDSGSWLQRLYKKLFNLFLGPSVQGERLGKVGHFHQNMIIFQMKIYPSCVNWRVWNFFKWKRINRALICTLTIMCSEIHFFRKKYLVSRVIAIPTKDHNPHGQNKPKMRSYLKIGQKFGISDQFYLRLN